MPQRFPAWRGVAFVGGLLAILVAVASPLDAIAPLLLEAHMVQHLLLMMLAPPLVWLGAPLLPLLRGLPQALVVDGLGPFLAWPALRGAARWLGHPAVAWLAFATSFWAWHVPALYGLALSSPLWHGIEHLCFLATGLLLWWPVVQPYPSTPRWPRWAMAPYLLLADVQNTILAAILVFADRVLYPEYAATPRLFGLSPIDDQVAAGAIMWVPGSIAFLVPAAIVLYQALDAPAVARAASVPQALAGALARRDGRKGSLDLLTVPILGQVLRWRHLRHTLQLVLLVLAAAVVADGFLGPRVGAMNLAGVLPWTYWRGFAILSLAVAGNFFCMACPFVLPRELARRTLGSRWQWPRRLRSKWLAVGLVALYLWAYEALGLWDSPSAAAFLVVAYFAAAFLIDGWFRGASFCKYVCPIGQYHFIHSTVSPLEVRVRDASTCGSCTGHECLRGGEQGGEKRRGCELELFLPRKVGNLDCTFCLDCVAACPHDNVGLVVGAPGRELADDSYRSSLGHLSRRPDVAALALLFVFGGFANAAAMVRPVPGALWLALVVLAPALAAAACTAAARVLGGPRLPVREIVCRFSLALIPLGLGMWLAHLLFHLLTGAATLAPVLQRAASDIGLTMLGEPTWTVSHVMPSAGAILSLQLLALDAGLLLTLYVSFRVASGQGDRPARTFGLLAPWATLAIALHAAGLWVVNQPMQMRGMLM
jgi:cytochrome c oxidase assembly factor CtaG